MVGVVGDTHDISTQAGGSPSILFRAGGERMVDGTTTTGHSTFTAGDVIGVALDLDNNTITWYKNGTQLHQYTSVDASEPLGYLPGKTQTVVVTQLQTGVNARLVKLSPTGSRHSARRTLTTR